jgi:hypothetical protein
VCVVANIYEGRLMGFCEISYVHHAVCIFNNSIMLIKCELSYIHQSSLERVELRDLTRSDSICKRATSQMNDGLIFSVNPSPP